MKVLVKHAEAPNTAFQTGLARFRGKRHWKNVKVFVGVLQRLLDFQRDIPAKGHSQFALAETCNFLGGGRFRFKTDAF